MGSLQRPLLPARASARLCPAPLPPRRPLQRAPPLPPPPQSHRHGISRDEAYDAYALSVHGRHLDVDPGLRRDVAQRVGRVLEHFRGALFLEGEGGIEAVDVRLMCARR
jgi:hypothetical protein